MNCSKKILAIFVFILLIIISLTAKSNTNPWNKDTITVGIKIAPPFIIEHKGNYSGVSIELWENIAKKLDVCYQYKLYDSDEMDKMLLHVSEDSIDISISPITVTAKRIKNVDFTHPFYSSQMAIVVPIKNHSSFSGFFFAFFSKFFSIKNIIIMVIILILIGLAGVIIWLIERKANSNEFSKGISGIGDGIWWAATTMSTIGPATKAPKSLYGRIFGVFWMFASIITISLLIGSVASYLTAKKMNSDINSISNLNRKSIGTMRGTSSAQFLNKNNISIADSSFKTIEDGLMAVANNKLQVFVYDEPILQYLINTEEISDKVYIIPLKLSSDYFSFALPKGSEQTNVITRHIVNELEGVTWLAILNRYNLK